jgi:serine/threonine protein kinase/beta-lactam-binding protein with PASTA domain
VIGRKLGGRYEILDRVGGGGMAVVYKTKDLLLHRIVAVKVLRPQYAIDDDFVHRFRREAQAAASLSHPNVVSIYDVGVEEDIHYIVMEYVEGSTLKEYITDQAPLSVELATYIARQIAEALDHAHHNQIIHRDIKPHNILIGKNQRVKVTDFGIARAVTSSTITHTGSVIGSVHYFSPEQARGGSTGEKSDIYSLGIVLYEMLTGTLPFLGDSPISVALKHLQESYTEPRELNSMIPQSVENIILRSLAKDPNHRYDSAKELIKDLDSCLEPGRLREEKVVLNENDSEDTKVVPAIRNDMYETRVATPRYKDEDDDDEEDWEDDDEERSRYSIWLKLGLSLLVILLLGFGIYQGYNYIMGMFEVQDIELIDVTTLPVNEAVEKLEAQGLRVDASSKINHDQIEEGYVISQSIVAGTPVKVDTYIRLTVSMGKEKEKMRSLVNMHEQTAQRLLKEFKEVEIIEQESNEISERHVIRHIPESDELVIPEETKVTLFISQGKKKFKMPDLIGKSRAEAEAILDRNSLELEKVEEDFSDAPEGEVYRQHPVDPDQEVEIGTPITIWVSKGYKEKEREKTEQITITLEDDETAWVNIFVTDVYGEDRKLVSEEITESKVYAVTVTVSREQDATIKVFKNNSLHGEPRKVTFE